MSRKAEAREKRKRDKELPKEYVAEVPATLREPVAAASAEIDNLFPVWSFRRLDNDGPVAKWSNLDGKDTHEILTKLGDLESLNRASLGARKCHAVNPAKIIKEAADRFKELRLDEFADDLWSFRLTGEKRVWGYWTNSRVHVLWWDPKHEVCPSAKKHT